MKGFGLLLIAAGVVGLFVGFNMDTTIEVRKPITIGDHTLDAPERVHNIGLIEQRSGVLLVSGLMFLSGVLLFGFGTLSEQLQAMARQEPASQTKQPASNGCPPRAFTPLDDSPQAPAASSRTRYEKADLDRLLDGECLPPKFDERGRLLQQASSSTSK